MSENENPHKEQDEESNVDQDVTVSVRALMTKEVGCMIGKKGETLRNIKSTSGSRIHISDGSYVERIVTVTGKIDNISTAFKMIAECIEEACKRQKFPPQAKDGQVTIRLIVPSVQCGYIIGKSGKKIKEICKDSGAFVQVGPDQLPGSTERMVTVSGNNVQNISKAIREISKMLTMGIKRLSSVIPYKPHTVAGGHGDGTYNAEKEVYGTVHRDGGGYYEDTQYGMVGNRDYGLSSSRDHAIGVSRETALARQDVAFDQRNYGLLDSRDDPPMADSYDTSVLAAIAKSSLLKDLNRNSSGKRSSFKQTHSSKMAIPGEFIGTVIGKKGAKLNEIRQISGTQIQITESKEGQESVKVLVIEGTLQSIAVAKSLITMSVEIRKAELEEQEEEKKFQWREKLTTPDKLAFMQQYNERSQQREASASASANPLANALPLLQLLAQPNILNSLSNLTSLNGRIENSLSGSTAGANVSGLSSTFHSVRPLLTPPGAFSERNSSKTVAKGSSVKMKQSFRHSPY